MAQPTEAPWGPGKPPFIIAEIGLTHEGSLGNAFRFVDACAKAGASAIKFQCHDGDEHNKFRPDCVWPQDESRQAYWKRTAFLPHEWNALRARADAWPIKFGCTPFSLAALGAVDAMRPDFIKVARQHAHTELHAAASVLVPPTLYTGRGGLGLDEYDPEEKDHIGISDHHGSIDYAMDAIHCGAQVAELHVCWDRRQFGPDVQYSVTIDELAELVRAVR